VNLEVVHSDRPPAAFASALGNSCAAATASDHHRRRTFVPRMCPPCESGNTSASGSPGISRSATKAGRLTVRPLPLFGDPISNTPSTRVTERGIRIFRSSRFSPAQLGYYRHNAQRDREYLLGRGLPSSRPGRGSGILIAVWLSPRQTASMRPVLRAVAADRFGVGVEDGLPFGELVPPPRSPIAKSRWCSLGCGPISSAGFQPRPGRSAHPWAGNIPAAVRRSRGLVDQARSAPR
jgi:hypothetical protein